MYKYKGAEDQYGDDDVDDDEILLFMRLRVILFYQMVASWPFSSGMIPLI